MHCLAMAASYLYNYKGCMYAFSKTAEDQFLVNYSSTKHNQRATNLCTMQACRVNILVFRANIQKF